MDYHQAWGAIGVVALSLGAGFAGHVLASELGLDRPWLAGMAFACTWPLALALAGVAIAALVLVAIGWLAVVVVLGLPIGLVQAIRGKSEERAP